MRKKISCAVLVIAMLFPSMAFALVDSRDTTAFMSGFQRVLMSTVQLPLTTVQRTVSGPIGIGTVTGVVEGTIKTVTNMVGGIFDMAAASAPYAKYAALAL